MKSKSTDLGQILAALHLVVWECDEDGSLRRQGEVSDDLATRFPALRSDPLEVGGQFRFLTHFVDVAQDRWNSGELAAFTSGSWEEDDATGTPTPFVAHALVVDGDRRLVVLERLGTGYDEKKAILQVAREGTLAYEELRRIEAALRDSEQRQQQLIAELDERVRDRTADLHAANEQLRREIRGHLVTQQALLDHQQELRTLADRLLLAEEQERRRIAVGLHDDLGQALALANIRLGRLAAERSDLTEDLGEIRLLLKKAITRVRTLTFELSSPILYELGLDAALESLVQQFGVRAELATDYRGADPRPVDEKTAIVVYQAIRELLHNVEKHAAATRVEVAATWTDAAIEIAVRDDGQGVTAEAESAGDSFGLFNVQQRLDHMGGSFLLQSAPGQGTTVTLRVPIPEGGRDGDTRTAG